MRKRIDCKSRQKFVLILLLFLVFAILSLANQKQSEPPSSKENQVLQELNKVNALLKKQNFAEAEALARAILDNIETSQEEDSLQTAQVVDALVRSIVGRKKQIDEESRSLIARS
jgi:hypothetical protein